MTTSERSDNGVKLTAKGVCRVLRWKDLSTPTALSNAGIMPPPDDTGRWDEAEVEQWVRGGCRTWKTMPPETETELPSRAL
jgi:hypothetical protein